MGVLVAVAAASRPRPRHQAHRGRAADRHRASSCSAALLTCAWCATRARPSAWPGADDRPHAGGPRGRLVILRIARRLGSAGGRSRWAWSSAARSATSSTGSSGTRPAARPRRRLPRAAALAGVQRRRHGDRERRRADGAAVRCFGHASTGRRRAARRRPALAVRILSSRHAPRPRRPGGRASRRRPGPPLRLLPHQGRRAGGGR